jgi:predicted nucleotidyltransferase
MSDGLNIHGARRSGWDGLDDRDGRHREAALDNPVLVEALTTAPAKRAGGLMPGNGCTEGDPRLALGRLRSAAASGELDATCRRHGVALLVAFGSTVHGKPNPRDLDLAIVGDDLDLLSLLNALMELVEFDEIDLMDLRHAGPLAKHRALVGGEVLFESPLGQYAQRRDGAVAQFMDTEQLRRQQLESLAR